MRWSIKVVPDDNPDAKGVWEVVSSEEMDFNYVPRQGFHVVQYNEHHPEPDAPCVAGNQAGYVP